MLRNFLLTACILVLLSSCWGYYRYEDYNPKKVLGYKPVYSNDSTLLRIYSDTAREVKNAGKIYTIGNLIFQSETGYGIHVIDYSDPVNLKKLGFINIRGNSEMSIKNNLLYANSFADLVVIDITDWKNVKEVKRIKNAFQKGMEQRYTYFMAPPERRVYYECVDFYKGIQTGWVKDSVYENQCYYN